MSVERQGGCQALPGVSVPAKHIVTDPGAVIRLGPLGGQKAGFAEQFERLRVMTQSLVDSRLKQEVTRLQRLGSQIEPRLSFGLRQAPRLVVGARGAVVGF